jgi:hypothetical protein
MSDFRGPGVVILVLSWVITLYTLWQMDEMHEMVPGKRLIGTMNWVNKPLVKSSGCGLWCPSNSFAK